MPKGKDRDGRQQPDEGLSDEGRRQLEQQSGTGSPQRGQSHGVRGQMGGSSALDQELNADDDGTDNGDELGENR